MFKLIILSSLLSFSCFGNELSVGYITGTKDTHSISSFNGFGASLSGNMSKEYAISAKIAAQLDYFSYYEKIKYSNDIEFKLRLAKKILDEYPTNIILGTGIGVKVNDSNKLEYYSRLKTGVSVEKEYKKILFEMAIFSQLSNFDVGVGLNTKIDIDPKYRVNIGMQKTFESEDIFSVSLISRFD